MRLLLLPALLILGCAHDPRPPPLSGWRELRSAHFRLRTDLPEGSARSTLARLESLRIWLQAAWSTGGDSPGSTNAIVVDDPVELRTFTEMPGIATTTRQGPLLVTAGSDAVFGDRSPALPLLAHEVAHELIRHRMPGAPRWFHEGLAGYLQTVTPLDDRRVRFGYARSPGVSEPELQTLRSTSLLRPRNLLSLDETATRRWETASEAELTDLYLSARLWVSLIRAEDPLRMRALERALAGGTPWRVAWGDLRASLDVLRLDEKLWRLLQVGGWPTEVRALEPGRVPPSGPETERLLAPWEIHLCLAELWAMAARAPGGEGLAPHVRAELEAAAAAAPDEPTPQVRLAELEQDWDLRRARAEALVRQYPRSPETLVFLARVLRDHGGPLDGRRAAALAAVSAAPDDVDALTAHAIEEVRAGDADAAFRTIARAEELEPWNPGVFVARAVLLAATGRCDEAADSVQRALDVLPDQPPPQDVRALVDERERVRATCRPRPRP